MPGGNGPHGGISENGVDPSDDGVSEVGVGPSGKIKAKDYPNGPEEVVDDYVSGDETINCPHCGETVPEENFHKDGEQPEIGYEYYECSDCGEFFAEREL